MSILKKNLYFLVFIHKFSHLQHFVNLYLSNCEWYKHYYYYYLNFVTTLPMIKYKFVFQSRTILIPGTIGLMKMVVLSVAMLDWQISELHVIWLHVSNTYTCYHKPEQLYFLQRYSYLNFSIFNEIHLLHGVLYKFYHLCMISRDISLK